MGQVTFLAAFFAAHSRWIYRPALAAPIAYIIMLAVWIGSVTWKMPANRWVEMALSASVENVLPIFATVYALPASAA